MEVKKPFPCEVCRGQGGSMVQVPEPDPMPLFRLPHDPCPEPMFETKWEPCAKCAGTGAVERWVWIL